MKGKIFNAQEVQAILNKSKVMFREVIKVQPANTNQQILTTISSTKKSDEGKYRWAELDNKKLNILNATDYFKCPYQVGDLVFVKETFYEDLTYRRFTGFEAKDNLIQINARYMNQEHSRITLRIKDIRVERLQDISEEDAYKEGVQRTDEWTGCADDLDFTDAFRFNWNATHKKPEEKWATNCWVWKIEFEVVK
jgi:hypothetical protein